MCVVCWFAKLLQNELNCVKEEWNNHYIRRSNNCKVSGVPDELYYLPETRNYEDCGISVSEDEICSIVNESNIFQEAILAQSIDDDDLIEYFHYIVTEIEFEYPPRDWHNAKLMYEAIIGYYN